MTSFSRSWCFRKESLSASSRFGPRPWIPGGWAQIWCQKNQRAFAFFSTWSAPYSQWDSYLWFGVVNRARARCWCPKTPWPFWPCGRARCLPYWSFWLQIRCPLHLSQEEDSSQHSQVSFRNLCSFCDHERPESEIAETPPRTWHWIQPHAIDDSMDLPIL